MGCGYNNMGMGGCNMGCVDGWGNNMCGMANSMDGCNMANCGGCDVSMGCGQGAQAAGCNGCKGAEAAQGPESQLDATSSKTRVSTRKSHSYHAKVESLVLWL